VNLSLSVCVFFAIARNRETKSGASPAGWQDREISTRYGHSKKFRADGRRGCRFPLFFAPWWFVCRLSYRLVYLDTRKPLKSQIKRFPRVARQEIALQLITQVCFFLMPSRFASLSTLTGWGEVLPENTIFTRVFTSDFTRSKVFVKNPKQTKYLPPIFRLTFKSSLKISFHSPSSILSLAGGQKWFNICPLPQLPVFRVTNHSKIAISLRTHPTSPCGLAGRVRRNVRILQGLTP